MVINIKKKDFTTLNRNLENESIQYKYPKGLNLKPGSELHTNLRDKVIGHANESHNAIGRRRNSWKNIERTLTSYIPLSDAEQAVKDNDDRKPIRIVIPTMFATLETLLTYWVGAFLRDPYFRFEGYGREDTAGAMLLEKTIQQQAIMSRMGLAMHTWWRDGLSAGFGAVTPMFERSRKNKTITRKTPIEDNNIFSRVLGMMTGNEGFVESQEEVPDWEGEVLYNIDYRNFLPDPTVPVYETHKGEASGWIRRSNYMTLFEEELANEGDIFNVQYLKGVTGESVLYDNEASTGRSEHTGSGGTGLNTKTKNLDTIYKYIKLIPFDWDLGSEKEPEIYIIALTADSVITQCRPIDNKHGDIPIAVNAPDYDGHTLLPTSRLETIYGLQKAIDWLFDSHIANVRKSINDMFVVDPSLVNMHDLANPGPGKLIRLRRSVFGKGVKDAVMQLGVNDVTRQNIADSTFIMDIINRTSAASDSVQGIIRKGSERRSATEFQGTMGSALSRIEKTAKITWMQGMLPLQRMIAEDTQQYMSGEQYVRINSEWQQMIVNQFGKDAVFESAPGKLKAAVDSDKLNFNYDIIPHDGSMPGMGDPQVWQQVLQTVGSSEMLSQKLDVFAIFKHFAQISGAKNIEDFEIKGQVQLQPQVTNDEEVAREAAAGNLLPLEGGI
ncbi:MAG: hypothetical protein GY804_01120 [Alphaproteobacteria bacterium]|nr:hypothetical protein [Alphaproteobacteria bacterium]